MKDRDNSIDILRGVAVVFMIASHIVWFLSDRTNKPWEWLRGIGDTICFVTFIFLFGVGLYFTIFSKKSFYEIKNKALKRLGELLIAYYIVAFISIIKDLKVNFDLLLVFKVLIFQHVPGFTEFMVPFILYTLFAYLIKKIFFNNKEFNLTSKKVFGLLIISILSYTAGNLIYTYGQTHNLPDFLENYLGLFTYYPGVHRFPILQYLPVLLLGMGYGVKLRSSVSQNINILLKSLSIIFITIFCILYISVYAESFFYINEYNRWPPSVYFLGISLIFCSVSLLLFRLLKPNLLTTILANYGKTSLYIMVIHIIILRTLELININKTSNFIVLLIWFIIILNFYNIINIFGLKFLRNKTK